MFSGQYETENVHGRLAIWKIMLKNRRFTSLFWAKLLKIWPYGGLGAHRKFGATSLNSARWHHALIGLQSTPWKSILPSYRANSGSESQKRARGHLSTEIGDQWRLSRVDSHSHWWSIAIPPRTGPTRISWPNSPLYSFTGGEGDSGNWELHVNQPNSAGILYNYLCILYITSNPSSFYSCSVKVGWILRL